MIDPSHTHLWYHCHPIAYINLVLLSILIVQNKGHQPPALCSKFSPEISKYLSPGPNCSKECNGRCSLSHVFQPFCIPSPQAPVFHKVSCAREKGWLGELGQPSCSRSAPTLSSLTPKRSKRCRLQQRVKIQPPSPAPEVGGGSGKRIKC